MAREGVPEADLERWADEGRQTVLDVADMLGVPPDVYTNDPLSLIPALQNYASRLPLGEFETSDWVTLQTDLMAYAADFLIQRHGARWHVVDDFRTPRGYRYVIEAEGGDGEFHRIDPVDVVQLEFGNPPIEIARMLASAEMALRLTSQINHKG
ncbi:hypothetical protein [Streptomyces sp. CB03238]|uniref:hypothetical protein n=1 Tax=Streptomyces sp. CB03238 TaxID=1907777 RepID=UPI000A11BBCF|nr:hypothetical protein [Streptomyces sp. CB03238]ORT57948.1 hypothetical protein BKD26_22635 [Streptomyces sp. CB03238]